MSLLKKLGAVAVGAGSLAVGTAAALVQTGLESCAKKVGSGSVSDSNGNTYTSKDFDQKAEQCGNFGVGIITGGFKAAKNLWQDD